MQRSSTTCAVKCLYRESLYSDALLCRLKYLWLPAGCSAVLVCASGSFCSFPAVVGFFFKWMKRPYCCVCCQSNLLCERAADTHADTSGPVFSARGAWCAICPNSLLLLLLLSQWTCSQDFPSTIKGKIHSDSRKTQRRRDSKGTDSCWRRGTSSTLYNRVYTVYTVDFIPQFTLRVFKMTFLCRHVQFVLVETKSAEISFYVVTR